MFDRVAPLLYSSPRIIGGVARPGLLATTVCCLMRLPSSRFFLSASAFAAVCCVDGSAQSRPHSRVVESGPAEVEPYRPGFTLYEYRDKFGVSLRAGAETRLRWEGIDGQFRAAPAALSDSLAFQRTNLWLELDHGPVDLRLELLDARQYFGRVNSSIGTGNVNPIDFLEAYADLELPEFANGRHRLRLGRETIDLGSRRLVARNRFRNTINSFQGIDWEFEHKSGKKVRAFWLLPVRRRPTSRTNLLDNDVALDDSDFDQQFFGFHIDHKWADPVWADAFEIYMYGLLDDGVGRRERDLFTPGVRVYRKKKRGCLDYEVELAFQVGRSQMTTGAASMRHFAHFHHMSVGYTFDAAWSPRVRLAWDYASGDRNPADGENNRFETLFGARRFEYGPTGIYGAVARGNLTSPELRLELKPRKNLGLMAAWRGVFLASESDALITAGGVRDQTGNSDNHVGQQFETRVRWDAIPERVRIELGAAYLAAGDFLDQAPGGRGQDVLYGYVQSRFRF